MHGDDENVTEGLQEKNLKSTSVVRDQQPKHSDAAEKQSGFVPENQYFKLLHFLPYLACHKTMYRAWLISLSHGAYDLHVFNELACIQEGDEDTGKVKCNRVSQIGKRKGRERKSEDCHQIFFISQI